MVSNESRSKFGLIPHLTVLVVILIYSVSNFMGQLGSLVGAGDSGPLYGISAIICMVTLVFVLVGLSAVVHEKENSTKMVTIALILFLVQLAFMFVEYAVLAVMLAD